MSPTLLCNIVNLIFGIPMAFGYAIVGVVWCITIIGIPFGLQCFKLAGLALWPFGREVVLETNDSFSLILNVVWIVFTGLEVAILHGVIGILFCITIIGIPIGLQHFKMAKLAFLPFGAEIS